eukprot:418137_1
MAETLQYARSKCTVTRTKNNHFIIIGGTTYESKRHMEVFNAHTDEMVLLLAMDIDLANMEQFTAFLFRDMLYINGGMNNVSDSETNRAFLYTNVTEHVQRYFASNHTEIAENITTSEDDVDTTFRWETLPIHLPHPLTGHISSVYDDTLYIIGGYVDGDHESPSQFTYTSLESLSHLLGDKSQIITTGGLNFEITSQIMPRWDKGIDPVIIAFGYTAPSFTVAPSAISCPHSCYTQYGDTLYIQLANDDQSNLVYVRYNFSSSSYHFPESFSYDSYRFSLGYPNIHEWNWPPLYADQCVIATDEGIIFSIGGYGDWESSEALTYNTSTVEGSWNYKNFEHSPGSIGFTDYKASAMACERYGDWIYMFGEFEAIVSYRIIHFPNPIVYNRIE